MFTNMIIVAVELIVSFVIYAGVGVLIGKVFYKNGYQFQKMMCWTFSVLMVVRNIDANLGFRNLVAIVVERPTFGVAMIVGCVAMIPAIATTMITMVKKYNFKRNMKEIQWLI